MAVLAVIATGSVQAADFGRFLCSPIAASGFRLHDGVWVSVPVTAKAHTYKFQPMNPYDSLDGKSDYMAVVVDADYVPIECHSSSAAYDPVHARIVCGGLGAGLVMDTKTLRYQDLFGIGFLEETRGEAETDEISPYLAIGTCKRLDDPPACNALHCG